MVSPTDGAVDRVRSPWCTTATEDAIRHFAWGIGDDNPLWHDADHAQRSRWGRIAPGCFAYAVDETTVAPGLDPLRRLYRSVEWTWFDALRLDAEIVPSARLIGETEMPEGVEQHGRVEFREADGHLLAMAETRCWRTAATPTPAADRPELRYSGAEIDAVEQAVLAETRRGQLPRYWEEITTGDVLPSVTKGPLSIMDVVAWCAATQGVPTEADAYSEGGLHTETATGPQQTAWIGQLVTNWMGDDAFLHRLRVDVRANPPLGSTTTIAGRVAAVHAVDGSPVAEVEIEATDQGGVASANGLATVLLPSSEAGPVVLPLERPIGL